MAKMISMVKMQVKFAGLDAITKKETLIELIWFKNAIVNS